MRRNPLIVLMAIELMWNAANLLLIAFARAWLNNAGHIFAFLVITVAAAEAAIGLAIVVIVFRDAQNVDVDEVASLRLRGMSMLVRDLARAASGALAHVGVRAAVSGAAGMLGTRRAGAFVRRDAASLGHRYAGSRPAALHQALVTWIPGFDFGLLLDPLSLLWALIITGVGCLIHLYSIGYMWATTRVARFFAYMNFFVFAMLTLVLSDNFVGLLVGWGLVGLASYFLIGFWFFKPSAVAAARKAFVINVVGDVGIMFAIFVDVRARSARWRTPTSSRSPATSRSTVAVLRLRALLHRRAAKSAQVPLHTWLPDAMEGPTPVSALIHAATMVTAGVYLVARCAPLWSASHDAQSWSARSAALTALPARCSASRSGTSSGFWPTRR